MKSDYGSHSDNSFTDEQAISLIKYILSTHKRVMPALESQDKWPNIDGYLEIQDSNNRLLGKLEAQVKALPISHDFKYKCDVSFFNYCLKVATLPVLLLLVDRTTERVYWIHVNQEFIENLDLSDDQQFKTIYFSADQYFDKAKNDYIQLWEEIVRSHREKFIEYERLKFAYELLLQQTNRAIGRSDESFVNIHLFLDEFNRLIDQDFSVVKDVFYPNQWKVGLAYHRYDKECIEYALYPIPLNKNDVLIKEVSENLHKEILERGLEFTGHYGRNPIDLFPKEYALLNVLKKVKRIIENKQLDVKGIMPLYQEYLFSFVDHFHTQLGLEIKNEYFVEELHQAFRVFLPLWIEEAIKLITVNQSFKVEELFDEYNGYKFVDPASLMTFLSSDELGSIAEKVRVRIQEEKVETELFIIDNSRYSFRRFREMILDLKNSNIDKVRRLYVAKDYSLLHEHNSPWSLDDLKRNLEIFFNNLETVYTGLIKNNFPSMIDELSLFEGCDKICVAFNLEGDGFFDKTYKMIYLKNEQRQVEQSLELISMEKANELEKKIGNKDDSQDNYKVMKIYSGYLDFIFTEFPLMKFAYDLIYKQIEEDEKALTSLFRNLRS